MKSIGHITNPVMPAKILDLSIERTGTRENVELITTLWPSMAEIHERLSKWVLDIPDPDNEAVTILESCLLEARLANNKARGVGDSDLAREYFWSLTAPLVRLSRLSVVMSREDEDPDVDDYRVWEALEEPYYYWRLQNQRYDQLSIKVLTDANTNSRIDDITYHSVVAGKLITREMAQLLGHLRFELAPVLNG